MGFMLLWQQVKLIYIFYLINLGVFMKAVENLPEGFKEIYSLDLQKNKKTAVAVNLLALIIAALMAAVMNFFVPIYYLFDFENGLLNYFLKFAVLMALIVAYMILHESVHGIAMKICGTKKVKYGFTGLYAFAGSKDFYDKKSYIFIALSPIVFLGVIIAVANFLVPTEWFWTVYFLQIANISGAAGDLFVTVKFLRFPKDILIQDYGVGMKVFSEKSEI